MYSGTTLKPLKKFDAHFGVHQKIDRLAFRLLMPLDVATAKLPGINQIIRFEGLDGPDGIKRKSPAEDELWHFYDPYDPADDQILQVLEDQKTSLIKALKSGDKTRAAFEMAWLAHGLVDGLTPAHHYPYEQELHQVSGLKKDERTSIKDKWLMPGATFSRQLANNWQIWGDKGLFFMHMLFEDGLAVIISPARFRDLSLGSGEIAAAYKKGLSQYFDEQAQLIAGYKIYDDFYRLGWTPKLMKTIHQKLMPAIIKTVALAWYCACIDAGLAENSA
ncbi:MAG: hypothetical protein ACREGA_02090 [Candidatus Saccharimonadales bacterium]